VVLRCEPDELLRRATSPDRAQHHKLIDPEAIRTYVATRTLLCPADATRLEVGGLTAAEAAASILDLAGLVSASPLSDER
jgi:hypothetical protein